MNYQPYPTTGRLASNMNLDFSSLKNKICCDQAEIYSYVVTTIKNQNGQFFQTGSAPNFQGDLVSLCTCKHFMRTFMDNKDWMGKWVAGFSGVAAGNGKNMLVFLMKVGYAYDSHQIFWFSGDIPDETKQAKLARFSKFGDIYQPVDKISDRFAIQNYFHPVENHVHTNCWHKDIEYDGCKGRKPALLFGDIDYSFLWDKPMIFYKGRLYRGQKKGDLRMLLDEYLAEV